MTAPDTVPAGAPRWIDLATSDAERSRDFYGRLFGWTAGEGSPEFGGYFMFFKDGVPVAGGMPIADPAMQAGWGIYLATDDAAKTVEAAKAHGSRALTEAMDVATLGTMAVVTDPGGASIGLWQAREFPGFGVQAVPGAPGWFELHTRDYDASVAFYREVFGWDAHTAGDTPEFRYTTLGDGDGARAGIMDASGFLPEGAPAQWFVYFAVADTDAALAEAGRLGGSVLAPAEDTPYGRLATAADPTGAQFRLLGPNVSAVTGGAAG